MAGSNIFVMYTSSNGQNVTVSPRLGLGHFEPEFDNATQITLLEGTGVSNNVMTANVRCSNCQSWNGGNMDFTGSSADWIHAYLSGSPMNTDDTSADISRHDDADAFSWDISQAKGGDSVNPFVTKDGTSSPPTNSNSNSSSTAPSKKGPFGGNAALGNSIITAHGVLASIAFIALFPTGGILIRIASFTGLIWMHAALQTLAFGFYIVAFGMGVYLANELDLTTNHHPILGYVIMVALLIQPVSGLLHHKFFQKYGRRTGWSWEHLGVGRLAIFLGMINGGHGLRLAGAEFGSFIAYGVCAAIMAVTYIVCIVIGERRRSKRLASGQPGSFDNQRLQSRELDSRQGHTVLLEEQFPHKA